MANGNGNGNRNKYSAQAIIEALEQTKGNIAHAARLLGCARATVYKYVNTHVTVKNALEDQRETRIDFVENKLMQQIEDGNVTAMIFFLKTQGKKRGWVERQEITGKEGEAMEIKTIEIVKDYGGEGLEDG